MKQEKESFDHMIDRCAWEIVQGLISGRGVRSTAVDIFNIVLGWQREHGKLRNPAKRLKHL